MLTTTGREMVLPRCPARDKRPWPLHCLGIATVLAGQKKSTHPTRILSWVPRDPSTCLASAFPPAKQGGGKACSSRAYRGAVSSPAPACSMGTWPCFHTPPSAELVTEPGLGKPQQRSARGVWASATRAAKTRFGGRRRLCLNLTTHQGKVHASSMALWQPRDSPDPPSVSSTDTV